MNSDSNSISSFYLNNYGSNSSFNSLNGSVVDHELVLGRQISN